MRLVRSSCLNSGVPVKPMKEAFGSASRMLRASLPGLRAVRLVRDHDDVVALAVGLVRVHVLVELVDQAEDEAMVLLQQLLQILAGCRPAASSRRRRRSRRTCA